MAVTAYLLIQTEVGKAADVVEAIRNDRRRGLRRRRDRSPRRDRASSKPRPSTTSAGWSSPRSRPSRASPAPSPAPSSASSPTPILASTDPHLSRRADARTRSVVSGVGGRRARCGGRGARSRARSAGRAAPGTAGPEASQSFGYIEIGVNPGIVLTSFTRNPRPVVLEEEVDPGHRLAAARLRTPRPRARAPPRSAPRRAAPGSSSSAAPSSYLSAYV